MSQRSDSGRSNDDETLGEPFVPRHSESVFTLPSTYSVSVAVGDSEVSVSRCLLCCTLKVVFSASWIAAILYAVLTWKNDKETSRVILVSVAIVSFVSWCLYCICGVGVSTKERHDIVRNKSPRNRGGGTNNNKSTTRNTTTKEAKHFFANEA